MGAGARLARIAISFVAHLCFYRHLSRQLQSTLHALGMAPEPRCSLHPPGLKQFLEYLQGWLGLACHRPVRPQPLLLANHNGHNPSLHEPLSTLMPTCPLLLDVKPISLLPRYSAAISPTAPAPLLSSSQPALEALPLPLLLLPRILPLLLLLQPPCSSQLTARATRCLSPG